MAFQMQNYRRDTVDGEQKDGRGGRTQKRIIGRICRPSFITRISIVVMALVGAATASVCLSVRTPNLMIVLPARRRHSQPARSSSPPSHHPSGGVGVGVGGSITISFCYQQTPGKPF